MSRRSNTAAGSPAGPVVNARAERIGTASAENSGDVAISPRGERRDLLSAFELECTSVDDLALPQRQARAAAGVLAVDAVSISMMIGRQRVLLGATGAAAVAESIEFTLGLGPSQTAHDKDTAISVPDLVAAGPDELGTWPGYIDEMLDRTPYRAVFAFPLSFGGLSLGTVCFYRSEPGELTPAETAEAVTVTERIFDDMVESGMFDDDAPRAQRWVQLPLAQPRALVWQAVGMTTVELAMTSLDALSMLRAYCFSNGLLLDEVAADIVARRLFLDQISA